MDISKYISAAQAVELAKIPVAINELIETLRNTQSLDLSCCRIATSL